VSVAYGALYYGFAVLITEPAAGGEFSRSLLSAAYGGAVLTGGVAAIPVGRIADRRGVRGLMAFGTVLAAGGLLLFSLAEEGWQETRIWCPSCGQRRLIGRLVPAAGELALRCTDCTPAPDMYIAYAQLPELMHGIKSYKPALSRLMTWSDEYYRRSRVGRILPCLFCGHPTRLRDGLPIDMPETLHEIQPLYMTCECCGETTSTGHAVIALCLGAIVWALVTMS